VAVLEARHLSVDIPTEDGVIHAVRDVSFALEAGELFGIAGESGSGKSVLTQAILGLLPNAIVTGEVLFEGRNLLGLKPVKLQAIRGSRIGMIFQDPMSSLHPYYTVGSQITEMIHAHEKVDKAAARRRAVDLLARVGISEAERRFDSFPHQFSGGMRQRVMIAMALILNPPLVIADEPTTALDVTVQAQIVALLDEMRRERGTTVVMITHDLGLLSSIADHVMVMYAGRRMELGPSAPLFAAPAHPYTSGLLASSPANYEAGAELVPIPGRPPSLLNTPVGCVFAPRCASALPRCAAEAPPLRVFSDGLQSLCWLEGPPADAAASAAATAKAPAPDEVVVKAEGVRLTYGAGSLFNPGAGFEVLKGIDLELKRGETLGLVGESGCGKSTFARVLAGLIPMTSGKVALLGRDLGSLDPRAWQAMRREVQLVFQNPFGALNPRRRVGAIIGDPFRIHGLAAGAERKREVQRLMELVGLNPEHYNRFPAEFSGGQRQRIGIARALALNPSLIIYDEPVSALDVSIQAQVLNLMRSLQRDLDLTYLFISHDLAVVRHVCDRIAVMQAGQIVELAEAVTLYRAPQHPYTQTLLAASVTTPPRHPAAGRTLVSTHVPEAA
jgi:peptide/nickel transport system ATP-binding protein